MRFPCEYIHGAFVIEKLAMSKKLGGSDGQGSARKKPEPGPAQAPWNRAQARAEPHFGESARARAGPWPERASIKKKNFFFFEGRLQLAQQQALPTAAASCCLAAACKGSLLPACNRQAASCLCRQLACKGS